MIGKVVLREVRDFPEGRCQGCGHESSERDPCPDDCELVRDGLRFEREFFGREVDVPAKGKKAHERGRDPRELKRLLREAADVIEELLSVDGSAPEDRASRQRSEQAAEGVLARLRTAQADDR